MTVTDQFDDLGGKRGAGLEDKLAALRVALYGVKGTVYVFDDDPDALVTFVGKKQPDGTYAATRRSRSKLAPLVQATSGTLQVKGIIVDRDHPLPDRFREDREKRTDVLAEVWDFDLGMGNQTGMDYLLDAKTFGQQERHARGLVHLTGFGERVAEHDAIRQEHPDIAFVVKDDPNYALSVISERVRQAYWTRQKATAGTQRVRDTLTRFTTGVVGMTAVVEYLKNELPGMIQWPQDDGSTNRMVSLREQQPDSLDV